MKLLKVQKKVTLQLELDAAQWTDPIFRTLHDLYNTHFPTTLMKMTTRRSMLWFTRSFWKMLKLLESKEKIGTLFHLL